MTAALLAAFLQGCGPVDAPATPAVDATLWVRGAAMQTAQREDEGDATTWTFTPRYGQRTPTQRTTRLDAEGRVASWEGRIDGVTVHVTVAPAGPLSWRSPADAGELAVPRRPLDPLAGGPAFRSWAPGTESPIWDGAGIRPLTLLRRTPGPDGLSLSFGDDASAWTLVLDEDDRPVRLAFPDGSALIPGSAEGDAPDPVDLLTLGGDPVPQPRLLRHLVVRWSDTGEEVTLTRPLRAEVPSLPVSGPMPHEADLAIHPRPAPLQPRSAGTTHRLDAVARAVAETRSRLGTDQRLLSPPDAVSACLEHADTLLALLRAQDVPARRVLGWLYVSEAGAWLRHAWVEVAFAEPIPWLAVDPALGQVVADAAHLPDRPPHALDSSTALVVLEAIGPDGPLVTRPAPTPP